MAETRTRAFSRLAKDIDTSGNIKTEGIASDVELGGGVTVYASAANLPVSGNTAGDQAFVTDTGRLYIFSGVGWYNVALINKTPIIQSVLDSNSGTTPFALSTDGTPTTITITAVDSDGETITYASSADSDFTGLATISQSGNEFTITPLSSDSATTTSGTITFTATDGINTATSGVQTFTLEFLSSLWDETVLSVGTSSTNSLDNSTFIDRSTNAYTVTASGSPTQTAFHPYLDNWSVEFDGSGDYITAPDSTDFEFGTSDFTIELFVKLNATNVDYTLVTNYGNSGAVGWGLQWRPVNYSGAPLRFFYNSTALVNSTWSPNANQWYHIAVSRSGSTIKLFVDGVELDSNTNSSNMTAGIGLTIGRVGDVTAQYFNGNISNLRIVNGTGLYTSAFTPPSGNLTAVTNTTFLGCQSNRFIDNSASAHTLTVNGNTSISSINPFGQGSEYASGENKGSVKYGSSTYLTGPNLTIGTNDFTIEFWGYAEDKIDGQLWMDWRTSITQPRPAIYTDGNGVLRYYVNGASKINGPTLPFKQWFHVAVSRNSGSTKMFLNGVQVGSTWSDTTNYETAQFKLGKNENNLYNTATISDVKIDIGNGYYTSDFTPPTAPVGNTNAELYIPMDNAGIYDKTGNATLTGSAVTTTSNVAVATSAIAFNNSPMFVTNTPPLVANDFTIEFWAECNVTGQACIFFDNHPTAYNGTFSMRSDYVTGTNSTIYGSIAGINFSFSYTVAELLNNHGHWAITRESGTFRIFHNGVQKYTTTGSNSSDISSGFYIGGAAGPTSGYSNLTGMMEGFQILLGVAKYTANFTPPTQAQGRQYQAES